MTAPARSLKELFLAALDVATEERAAWLERECGSDADLRRQLGLMLAAHDAPQSLLDRPAAPGSSSQRDDSSRTTDAETAAPGTMIGPYKLLEQIGEGGFGVVYMAEQTEPVRRKVALKILKPGMDTRHVVARFEAERQALAIMDHPNIAKVFDGGMTGSNPKSESRNPKQIRSTKSQAASEARQEVSDIGASDFGFVSDFEIRASDLAPGRPYFVMELVKGVPITEFCDQNHLTPRQRLDLFLPVCQAVQHAHHKGIIHRDLKPTNVLVSRHDSTPVVKVIDFGIAKALGQELTDKTLFTGIAQMVGTPLYMSPEQAGMSDLDIDTRSDIYSLGVLLYELLTGTTPFDRERFKQAAYDEIRRIIREEDPPKPSTRLSHLSSPHAPREEPGHVTRSVTATLAAVAAQRQTEPAKLTKLVRGELDWIVMKALEKDRNRRYETANGFAMDLQRYLADEPVQACPPSVGYRLRKFARRNKSGLAVAALVLFFLALLGSGVGWAVRDRSAREAEVARQQAERETRAAGQVESIFAEVDRLEKEQKLPEALAAARRAEAALSGGAANAATAQRVGERLKDFEFVDRLEQIRMTAATMVEGKFDNAGAARAYARAFRDYGVDIEELAVETSIERLKTRPALAIPLAAALDDWVHARREVSEADAASWKRLVAVARGIDPDPLRDRLRSTWGKPASEVGGDLRRLAESIDVRAQHPATLVSLARTLRRVEQSDSRLRLLRDAQSVYPGDFWLNFELGRALFEQKDHQEAARFGTAAVSIRPRSCAALSNLGSALSEQNKLDEAVACFRKAIELDPKFARAHGNLGITLQRQKKPDEALAAYREVVRLEPDNADARNMLGIALFEQGKVDEAIAEYHQAIKRKPDLGAAHLNLALALQDQGKIGQAIMAFEKVIELEPDHALRHDEMARLLATYPEASFRDPKRAVELARRAVELDPEHCGYWFTFGVAYYRAKRWNEALTALEKSCRLDKVADGKGNPWQWLWLAMAHWQIGHKEEARSWYDKAVQLETVWPEELVRFEAEAAELLGVPSARRPAAVRLDQVRTLVKAGQWDQAAAQLAARLEELPRETGPGWDAPRRRLCRELAQWDEVFRRVVQLRPGDTDLWIGRGRHFALRGDWEQAAAAYARVIHSEPLTDEAFEYACLLLLREDHTGYRQWAHQVAERAARSNDHFELFVAVRTCAVAPDPVVPAPRLLQWAKQMAGKNPPAWYLHALGAACYRAGDFEQAVRSLQESNAKPWGELDKAQNWLVLAMVQHRVGRADEARQSLDEARRRIADATPADAGAPAAAGVPDWLVVLVLRREAEALLTKEPGDGEPRPKEGAKAASPR